MHEVVFDEKAIDSLNELPKQIKERIFSKIIAAKENPLHYFERLKGRKDYKLRIGDYRVVADIDINSRKIKVTLAGHRKNIYDK